MIKNNLTQLLFCVGMLLTVSCTNRPQTTEVSNPVPEGSAEEAVLDNIQTRVTIRAYQNKPVEADKVERLLRAAMAAPTALNAQPWHFIVITDKTILQELSTANSATGILASAPMAIAVCGDLDKALKTEEKVYWIQDVAAATENILLAAHAMGLGASWTGSYPAESRHKVAERILGLPNNVKAVTIVAVGYPAMTPNVKDKWNPANISYDVYGGQKND